MTILRKLHGYYRCGTCWAFSRAKHIKCQHCGNRQKSKKK